jgi:heme/copper-type cytochrome/quinol oxidase subunit 1
VVADEGPQANRDLYLIVVSIAATLGGIFAALIRVELTTPAGDLLSADA